MGWSLWAVGTQVALANPITAPLFAFAAYKFFDSRIPSEERYLHEFFGDDYIDYSYKVPTRMPFVSSYSNDYIHRNLRKVIKRVKAE